MSCCHCSIATELHGVAKEIAMLRFVLSRPGRLGVRRVEGTMPGFVITLPPIVSADTATRELAITVGEAPTFVLNPALVATESETFGGEHNQNLHVELVDIDGVGNRSTPSVLDAVLLDTMAPPQPGQLGVRQVSD